MNVYDKAHELSAAIKESQEFKEYDSLKKEIEKNPEINSMMKDFQNKQIALQAKQFAGEKIDAEDMKHIQELYQIVLKDPTAARYMQAEMRFSLMINDVYKIIGETIDIEKRMGLSNDND